MYTVESNSFLKSYINKDGKVNYDKLKENEILFQKIGEIENKNLQNFSSKTEEFVFWLNAYNLLVIKGVIEEFKKNSSWNGTKSYLSRIKFFVIKKFDIGNQKFSLYYIENKILRKKFKDPRIHFAINCASTSCPIIPSTLFVKESIDDVLDTLTSNFINNENNIRINPISKEITLNPIFKWYKEDFQDTGGIISFIKKYHTNFPINLEKPKLSFSKYDWSLNNQ